MIAREKGNAMSTEINSSPMLNALERMGDTLEKLTKDKTDRDLAEKANKAKAEKERKAAFDGFPKSVDFLLSTPLYKKVDFSGDLVWPVLDLVYFNSTYDCYCVECEQSATFKGT